MFFTAASNALMASSGVAYVFCLGSTDSVTRRESDLACTVVAPRRAAIATATMRIRKLFMELLIVDSQFDVRVYLPTQLNDPVPFSSMTLCSDVNHRYFGFCVPPLDGSCFGAGAEGRDAGAGTLRCGGA